MSTPPGWPSPGYGDPLDVLEGFERHHPVRRLNSTHTILLIRHGWGAPDLLGLLSDWPGVADSSFAFGLTSFCTDAALAEATPDQARAWARLFLTDGRVGVLASPRVVAILDGYPGNPRYRPTAGDLQREYVEACAGDHALAQSAYLAGLTVAEVVGLAEAGKLDRDRLRTLAGLRQSL